VNDEPATRAGEGVRWRWDGNLKPLGMGGDAHIREPFAARCVLPPAQRRQRASHKRTLPRMSATSRSIQGVKRRTRRSRSSSDTGPSSDSAQALGGLFLCAEGAGLWHLLLSRLLSVCSSRRQVVCSQLPWPWPRPTAHSLILACQPTPAPPAGHTFCPPTQGLGVQADGECAGQAVPEVEGDGADGVVGVGGHVQQRLHRPRHLSSEWEG